MKIDQLDPTKSLLHHSTCNDCQLCTNTINNRRVRIDSEEVLELQSIIKSHTQVKKNHLVYKVGQTFTNLYTVHSGMFKSIYITNSGEERIVEVFIPGQIIGFDGIRDNRYRTTVKAVSSGSFCIIPYQQLNDLAFKYREIQNRLLRMMSEKILQTEISHSEFNATQKLIHFVKTVSDLYYSRGFSAKQFPFPISQRDLANFLGLAEETLSRNFAKLKAKEVMILSNKQISILDLDAFTAILD